MPAALLNKTKGMRRIGAINIAPGMAAVIQDDKWSKNAVVKEWIADGQLEVVPIDSVDNINKGMDVKKAKASAKADEKEKDEGKTPANTPPK